ncbi:MAG: hypothetical protein ACPLVI_00835 [Thermoplasmata archaeon]|jgi:Flp pilus assembly protein TadD|nr:hypothetical protein [Thermoplasmatales archaeon]PMP75160.1 MAG: hypothetical protein C0180_02130 [Aciduliprofundum sp.]
MPLEFSDLYKVAEGLICAKKYREAYAIYIILLKIRPQKAALWHGLANCLEKIGDGEGSRNAYRMALKYHLMENEKGSNLWAGWAAMKLGDMEMAYRLFKEYVEKEPDYAYGWISLAAAASKLNKKEEAEDARRNYRILKERNPYKRRECEGKEMLISIMNKSDGVINEFIKKMVDEIECDQ